MKNHKSCLYLTYDGFLDPLGRSQILPYLERFAKKGVHLTVISFEKVHVAHLPHRQRLTQQGIRWIPLRYHKWPLVLSTLFDLFQGLLVCTWICWRRPPQIVHARGYVTAVLALWVKQLTRAKFLFDMRGFWPEERVEGGLSRPNGFVYRSTKWWERRFFRAADHIVLLSHVAKGLLENRLRSGGLSVPITVVPTCTDLNQFTPEERFNKTGLTRVVYVGSVGTWYLFGEMVQFFQELYQRLPRAHLTILTPRPDPSLTQALKDMAPHTYDIQLLTHEEVPKALRTMHASLCFIKPVGSKKASCPTKVGESLACGVPVVITKDIGDCDQLIERKRVGVVVSDLSKEGYRKAVEQLITLTQEGQDLVRRCRRVAADLFDLERGVEVYLSLYEDMATEKAGESEWVSERKVGFSVEESR